MWNHDSTDMNSTRTRFNYIMKALFITEKPSVAREFAAALNINAKNRDGYMEGDKAVITWCVGHLVTMSYPDQYDPALKKWDLETIPFIPDTFKYETIPGVQNLPSGRPAGQCQQRQEEKTCLDRLPDKRRSDPRGKRSERLK